MKRVLASFLLLFAFILVNVSAQEKTTADLSRWSIAVKGGVDYFRVSPSAVAGENGYSNWDAYKSNAGWTVPSVALEYTINPLFGLGLDVHYLAYDNINLLKGRTLDFTAFGSLNISNLVTPVRTGFWSKVNLYGNVGVGAGRYQYETASGIEGNSVSPVAYTALSAEYNLSPSFALIAEGQYRTYARQNLGGQWSTNVNNNDGVAALVGLRVKFGAKSKTHTRNMTVAEYYPAPKPVVDRSTDPEVLNRIAALENDNKVIKNDIADIKSKLQSLDADLKTLAAGSKITATFQNIEFEFDSNRLTSNSKSVIDQVIGILNSNTWSQLNVAGHTDNIGDASYNQKLSEKRAEAVKAYLVSKGIPAAKISTAGFGPSKPIADNKTREGRQRNRRVEFEITK